MSGRHRDELRDFILDRFAGELDALGLEPEDVPEDFDLLSEGIMDSLALLELVTAIEERYGVEVALDGLAADRLTLVGPLVEHLAQQTAPARPAGR